MNLRYVLLLLFIPFAIIVSVYAGKKTKGEDFTAAREMVVLREIGHHLLLSTGDHSSRVLPIRKIAEGKYQIHFEKELNPTSDSFVAVVQRSLMRRMWLSDYAANLISCNSKEVVYGFVSSVDSTSTIVPCLERTLPKGCYIVEILWNDKTGSGEQGLDYLPITMIALLIAVVFIWNAFKRKRPPTVQPIISEEFTQESSSVQIGSFVFSFSQRYLSSPSEKIDLTRKEAELLFLLAHHRNEVIEREVLQKKIWENEGVIVTRSLDMFISRLRKKLSSDPAIKLVNVPKKGYMLRIDS